MDCEALLREQNEQISIRESRGRLVDERGWESPSCAVSSEVPVRLCWFSFIVCFDVGGKACPEPSRRGRY
jgi:hypothetical protein